MKKILLTILLAASLPAGFALANIKCGLKPLPPLGCSSDDAICICDSDGNCSWFFAGCGYSTFTKSASSDWLVVERAGKASEDEAR